MSKNKLTPFVVIVDDDPAYAIYLKKMILKIVPLASVKTMDNIGKMKLADIPDIIFHDVRIPPTEDAELIRQAKKTYPHIPIIAMSGYHEKEIRALMVVKSGCTDYVSKDSLAGDILERMLQYAEL